MPDNPGSFMWYELMSTDTTASKTFYGKVVGWETQDVPISGMTYTLLRAGDREIGGMMTLPQQLCEAGMKPSWAAHIGVGDVDATAGKLQQLGGKVHRPPTDIPNVGRFAAVADPQGARFFLFKPMQAGEPTQAGVPPVSSQPGPVGWHELHTTDWPGAFEFYSAMFGWKKGDAVDMGPMGTYQLFTIAGSPRGGMFNIPTAQSGCFWLYYFNVENIDAAAQRVSDNGGTNTNGPHQVPGGGWIVQATDPQGAAFALLGARK
jgi:predicted enzyme related to lactoylglutathione lyase